MCGHWCRGGRTISPGTCCPAWLSRTGSGIWHSHLSLSHAGHGTGHCARERRGPQGATAESCPRRLAAFSQWSAACWLPSVSRASPSDVQDMSTPSAPDNRGVHPQAQYAGSGGARTEFTPTSAMNLTSLSLRLPSLKTVSVMAVTVVIQCFPYAQCHETLWVQGRHRPYLETGHESWNSGPRGPTCQRNGINRSWSRRSE